jgi:hypothetical protein
MLELVVLDDHLCSRHEVCVVIPDNKPLVVGTMRRTVECTLYCMHSYVYVLD